jgi:hypothetical protein
MQEPIVQDSFGQVQDDMKAPRAEVHDDAA